MSVLGTDIQLKGSCFCGLATFTVAGAPARKAYCHCTLCQRLSASPFGHTLNYNAEAFQWTHPPPHADRLDSYKVPTKPKTRYRCKVCGTNVAQYSTNNDRWSVWAATLERDPEGKVIGLDGLIPTGHIFYGTRVLDVNDGLGKWEGYENDSVKLG